MADYLSYKDIMKMSSISVDFYQIVDTNKEYWRNF